VQFLLDGYVAAQAEVVDISTSGIGVLSAENLGDQGGYEIRLACDGGPVPRVELNAARVVWWQSGGLGRGWRMGLRLNNRREETLVALEWLIQATCQPI
jgi:hypothetical protein